MQSPQFIGQSGLLEMSDSPRWSFSKDKGAVLTRAFRGPYATALASRPPIGAFGLGTYAGLRVTDVQVTSEKPGIGQLTWTMEGALLTNGLPELPPETASVDPVKQEFRMEKHPLYSDITLDTLSAINSALSATKEEDRADYLLRIYEAADTDIAVPLYEKMAHGETHFVLYMPVYKWTFYSLTTPTLDEGGYLQDPYGPIPIPPGFDWLREADAFEWTGSFWKVTRTWQALINPDPDIYPVNIANL